MTETLRLGTVGTADDVSTRKMGTSGKTEPRRCPTCETVFTSGPRFCPFDGEPLEDEPHWDPSGDPIVGKTIDDRYEVCSVIGEGGMGTVYHAHHLGLDRVFALKLLRREHAADRESVDRFLQEARVAAGLGHENLVAVTDFGEVGRGIVPGLGDMTLPYFVMDRLEGESLADLLRRESRLAPARAADIVTQCASGLSAAHAAGVVHRDLKPDNVFLVRQGNREVVKLLDFGVAKILGASRLTKVGTVYGTPHYMSPEQASGDPVDARADVYALGVILYECLAGRVPFSADTFMGVLTHHMFTEPEPLDEGAPQSGPLEALRPIVMRCLKKRPEERFGTMDELAEALRPHLTDAEADAPAPSRAHKGGDPLSGPRVDSDPELPLSNVLPGRRWPWLLAILALGVLVGAWFGLSTRETEPVRSGPAAKPSAAAAPMSTPAPEESVPAAASQTAPPSEDPEAEPSAGSATPRSLPRRGPRGPRRSGGSEIVDPWGD